jgi:hypothetical protein
MISTTFWNYLKKYQINGGECMILLVEIAFHESSEVSVTGKQTMIYVCSNLFALDPCN